MKVHSQVVQHDYMQGRTQRSSHVAREDFSLSSLACTRSRQHGSERLLDCGRGPRRSPRSHCPAAPGSRRTAGAQCDPAIKIFFLVDTRLRAYPRVDLRIVRKMKLKVLPARTFDIPRESCQPDCQRVFFSDEYKEGFSFFPFLVSLEGNLCSLSALEDVLVFVYLFIYLFIWSFVDNAS